MNWLQHTFGVPEVFFLVGFCCFFLGISNIWSIYGAFAVSGAILMVISILSIVMAQKKGK